MCFWVNGYSILVSNFLISNQSDFLMLFRASVIHRSSIRSHLRFVECLVTVRRLKCFLALKKKASLYDVTLHCIEGERLLGDRSVLMVRSDIWRCFVVWICVLFYFRINWNTKFSWYMKWNTIKLKGTVTHIFSDS